jgi:transposase
MARSKNGQAISADRRTPEELFELSVLLETSRAAGDLATWRRAQAVTAYLGGSKVKDLVKILDVARSSVNTWLRWYQTLGAQGLQTGKSTGAPQRLTQEQRAELAATIEAGPQAAGFTSGMWTGPMLREHIFQRFGVGYHNHSLPRLLNQLGFSVQRPRKLLARADAQKQSEWINERFPAVQKKPLPAGA